MPSGGEAELNEDNRITVKCERVGKGLNCIVWLDELLNKELIGHAPTVLEASEPLIFHVTLVAFSVECW